MNVLKKTLIIVLLIIIAFLSYTYFEIKNRWNIFYTESQVESFTNEIKNTQSLPDNFYELYNLIYPERLNSDLNQYLINGLFNSSKRSYPPNSLRVVRIRSVNTNFESNKTINNLKYYASLTWKIEKATTQIECLNWYTNNYDFLYNNIGIKKACKYYYNKELNNLDTKEIIGIILMLENPFRYNPKKFPERTNIKIENIIKTLANNK